MKYLFKFLFFLLITAGISYGLYHTSFGKQWIDERITELTITSVSSLQSDMDTGVIVQPELAKDPLQTDSSPTTILGKRLEYYRANKSILGVQ